jgi:hypothetical protein
MMRGQQRPDLIGLEAAKYISIKIIDAHETIKLDGTPGSTQIKVTDSMGNTYWTEMDDDVCFD